MIDSFWGPFRFLSNFYESPLVARGFEWPTVEHAYQAFKTDDSQWKPIRLAPTPGIAKRLGAKVIIAGNWETIKVAVMLMLLRIKFQDSELRKALLMTDEHELIEGNNWHDTFWGVCDGTCRHADCSGGGENNLGKLLMKVREEIK